MSRSRIAAVVACVAALAARCEGAWEMVWNDEFDGAALNASKWSHEVNCDGGGNNEQQCYTASGDNSWVAGGVLTIKAMPSPGQPLPYSSARISSKNKGDWTYGKFEARVKLPFGQGSWPAFWMLPTEEAYGTWPLSGEIDVMEAVNLKVGGERTLHGTLHYGDPWPNNKWSGKQYVLPAGANPADDYHVYSVEWEEGEIRWYVDGTHFSTQQRSTANFDGDGKPTSLKHRGWWHEAAGKPTYADAPFDRNFHLLLNFAVGGDWAANVNSRGVDAAAFAGGQSMLVDYVRVYRCGANTTNGRGCATTSGDYLSATLISGAAPDLTSDAVVVESTTEPPLSVSSQTCEEQWNNSACPADGGGCSTCGARVEQLTGAGAPSDAAREQVAADFPEACGACGAAGSPSCSSQWNRDACQADSGECFTCGARIDWLVSIGMSNSGARSQVARDYPAECGACLEPAAPPTCGSHQNSSACASDTGECHTCAERVAWLVAAGTPSTAAHSQVASEFAEACSGCAPTCSSQLANLACQADNGECYTCGSRIDYLVGTGLPRTAAEAQIGGQFPAECGACTGPATPPPPSCASQWGGAACHPVTGECSTCGDRIESLVAAGVLRPAAGERVGTEFPAECGACVPPTCAAQLGNAACDGGVCYTCGARIDYVVGTGLPRAAAEAVVASEFPVACGACAAPPTQVPATPAPPVPPPAPTAAPSINISSIDVSTTNNGTNDSSINISSIDVSTTNNGTNDSSINISSIDVSTTNNGTNDSSINISSIDVGTTNNGTNDSSINISSIDVGTTNNAVPTTSVPLPPQLCAAQLGNAACDASGCHSCGSRANYLVAGGVARVAAEGQVAGEFPAECGACGVTQPPVDPAATCAAQRSNSACQADNGECYTCGARIDWLAANGMLRRAAEVRVASEFPAECGACMNSAAPEPTATCETQRHNSACQWDNGECHTCGARIEWFATVGGLTGEAAEASVAAAFPCACGACAPAAAALPSAGSCCGQWNNAACQNGTTECYSCGARVVYVAVHHSLSKLGAEAQIAAEFPGACGACAPCGWQWGSLACQADTGECYTCGARVDYLVSSGHSESAALTRVASEFPSDCGLCA
ncbi:Glucan endo-1 [Diplonema papillatum]|nr:Glucan endo-1 [Diplonema papillatum]